MNCCPDVSTNILILIATVHNHVLLDSLVILSSFISKRIDKREGRGQRAGKYERIPREKCL